MKRARILGLYLVGIWLLFGVPSIALADVSAGDVVSKKEWKKAEGLLPEPILAWLKNGDFVIKVGELNYDPKDYRSPGSQNRILDHFSFL